MRSMRDKPSLYWRLRQPFWRLFTKLETELHPLRYLFWECTRRCNLRCRHCGSDCTRESDVPELTEAQVLRVMKEIAEAYPPQKIMVVITGGEPLVRKDLLPIMAQIRALGFRLGMVTNGFALDQEKAHQLAQVGLESVVVSLDGPPQEHNWLRHNPRSYERAVGALSALLEVGIPLVEAITCVHNDNLKTLDETFELLRDLGVRWWRLFNIFAKGRAEDDPILLLTEENLCRFIHDVARLRDRGKKEGMHVSLSEEGYLGLWRDPQLRDTPYFCRAGISIAGILCDGTAAACPNLPPELGQGNVLETPFPQIWEERYEAFRDRSWMQQGECASCEHWSVCLGNSLHVYDFENKRPRLCHFQIFQKHPNPQD
jgi:radical SAM protein with 4Fe4S-binding SPASM domain